MKTSNKRIIKRSREPSAVPFSSGSTVPRSGVYGTLHARHHLVLEANLIQGHIFPSCPRCDDPIVFKLVTPIVAESASARFRLLMAKEGVS